MEQRILVVDDDKHARRAFLYALKGSGYQVDTVESGHAAVAKVQECTYELIFLDLKMPGMDGVDTLRALHQRRPEIPVYIVTAYEEEFMVRLREAARSGLHFEVAAKPLDDEQIRTIVAAFLHKEARPG